MKFKKSLFLFSSSLLLLVGGVSYADEQGTQQTIEQSEMTTQVQLNDVSSGQNQQTNPAAEESNSTAATQSQNNVDNHDALSEETPSNREKTKDETVVTTQESSETVSTPDVTQSTNSAEDNNQAGGNDSPRVRSQCC
ncbi:hypothetical protein ACVR0O_00330 [Streptococcus caviae]|uniref:hypothetical protein n=1 Tax=Streptococcus sp. 'caviae' TaxID=1915004 RepID=UPI00094BADDA|nr:hypothetical protein [Streptococcus sp. 'caviae']OLN84807.1 hypothetical protein BMI76_01645 [Streptococcus sp. 'caviae']